MNPIIWTCVFGGDDYFNILRTSLESLVKYGRYTKNICIFSDRNVDVTLNKYVPEELRSFTTVLPLPSTARLSVRYDCAELLPEGHDVYLYVDTDIIYDDSIWPVLWHIKESNKICFSSEKYFYPNLQFNIGDHENQNLYNAEWFGLKLAIEDTRLNDCQLPLINSGIIGCNNLQKLIDAFSLIKLKIEMTDPAYIKEFGDQPVVNYVMASYKCDTEITRYVHFTNATPPEDHIRFGFGLRGIMHFLWSGKQKLGNMVAYTNLIAKVKP